MIRRPPRSTRTYTLFPYTTLFRSAKRINQIILFINIVFISFSIQATKLDKLFDYPQYQNPKISPDGKHIAISVLSKNKRALAFIDRETLTQVGGVEFANNYEPGDYHWANSERVVISMEKRQGWLEQMVSYGELYAVNFDGSKGEMIYGYQAGEEQIGSRLNRKDSTFGWGKVIDVLPEDKRHILISSTPMSKTGERLASVLKLDIYNGKIKKKIATSPVPFATFLTDVSGQLRAVIGTDRTNTEKLYLREDGKWRHINTDKVGSNITPISISTSGKHLYTLDDYNQDKRGIFKFSFDDYSYKSIYTDKKVNISGVEMSTDGRSVYGLKLDDGYPSYLLINSKLEEAKVYKDLIKSFPYSEITITSKTKDGNFYIVFVSSDISAGEVYLFDKEKNKLKNLFNYNQGFKSSEFVQVEPIEFKASDGQTINGFFTPGKTTKKDKPAPVVVLVHGGPHGVRDYWNFSSTVQYLALSGFSVLQVNYRGSGGYGYSFESAGYESWGNISQQDIYDGVQWLVSQAKVQPDNVCIMGASFGAYSAIQSAALYPSTYKCAIANAGIYDLEMMFEKGDIYQRRSGKSYLTKVLGTDKEKMKNMSPVNYVNKIEASLLLAHGEEDERAPYEQFEKLSASLDKANKSYEWFVIDKEGHGFFNPDNQKAYMKKVVSFLDEHLK